MRITYLMCIILFLLCLFGILFTNLIKKKYMFVAYVVIFVGFSYFLMTHDSGIDTSVPFPMLAYNYKNFGDRIQYPCFIQKKIDGVRCMAIPQKGLFSRYRKSFPYLDHIREEINLLPPDIVLDGELYSDTISFQEIVEQIKEDTLSPNNKDKQLQMKYHVYDIMSDQPYAQRYERLQQIFNRFPFKHLVLVDTEQCDSEKKMKELHDNYVADGYEGVILRNKLGGYLNDRSIDLQKYKEFSDTEVTILGFKSDKGEDQGCVIWICEYEDKLFAFRSRGSQEQRRKQFQNGATYIGKHLTIRYQGKTDDGRLRFPIGIAIRDYE
jgi:ATP-dependent DNA ligase